MFEVNVCNFSDNCGEYGELIDFGFYVSVYENFRGEENNYTNEEITGLFSEMGIDEDYKKIALENGAYIDEHDGFRELFFRNESDAIRVKEIVENLLTND